jgi:RNA polymerase sigma-70 factor (ECF subfamily)
MNEASPAARDVTDTNPVAQALAEARPRWVAFVRSRVPSDLDADDVVQRALTRATRNADRLRDATRLVPWFYRILRRGIADALAARAKDAVVEGVESMDDLPLPPADTEIAAACACVAGLLDGLRPEYAEVLRRVVLEDESLREAAQDLAITENNAAVRLHRARTALRRELESCCGVSSLRACLDCTCDIDGRCGGHASASASR